MAKSIRWGFSVEELKKELEKRAIRNRCIIDGLKAISFRTKKDGTPFKKMAQNFENCIYIDSEFPKIELQLKINYDYSYYSFYCYTDKNNGCEVCKYDFYGRPKCYYLSLEEIKGRIKEEIEKHEKELKIQNELLADFENREEIITILKYKEFCEKLGKYISPIEKNTDLKTREMAYLLFDFI